MYWLIDNEWKPRPSEKESDKKYLVCSAVCYPWHIPGQTSLWCVVWCGVSPPSRPSLTPVSVLGESFPHGSRGIKHLPRLQHLSVGPGVSSVSLSPSATSLNRNYFQIRESECQPHHSREQKTPRSLSGANVDLQRWELTVKILQPLSTWPDRRTPTKCISSSCPGRRLNFN